MFATQFQILLQCFPTIESSRNSSRHNDEKTNKRALIKEKDIIITFKDRQLFHRRHRPKDLSLNDEPGMNHFLLQ